MKPPRPSRPARWPLLVGAVAGTLLGVVAYAAGWNATTPGASSSRLMSHLETEFDTPSVVFSAFVLGGVVFGAVTADAASGAYRLRGGASVLRLVLVASVGGLLGGLLGVAAFVGLSMGTVPGETVPRLVRALPDLLGEPASPASILAWTGAAVGGFVAAVAFGGESFRRLVRTVVGLLVGVLAGITLYAVAHVAIHPPALPTSLYRLFLNVGQAVYADSPAKPVLIGLGALVGLLLARHGWRFYGVVTFAALSAILVGFVGYALFVTLPRVEPEFRLVSTVLFVAETASLTMVLLYSFYTIDVAVRKRWLRGPANARHSKYYMPKVAFQVACYNEPFDLVRDTLRRLEAMDYPQERFVIQVLDDSTKPECAEPLKAYCEQRGHAYIHRDDRKGYKAGALNHALQFLPRDAEFIAVIDADYQVQPEYLREAVGYFIDPSIAWVQTPQDYRNRDQSFLTEQYYLADAYFYRTVMPSRNEENTIIFCGTMGILRRAALEHVGGWGEKYISEDAELALRLLNHGWGSLYVNKTYGRGLIPATFDGYKKQHYRWAFGGAKILRGHFFGIFLGRLSRRQIFDYFVGCVHWFEGLFIVLISLVMLTLGIASVLDVPLATHHSQEILLVGLVPLFVLADGLTRLHMVLRESMQLRLRQTIRVLGMWFSVKFSNAFAATKSMLGFQLPFVRTAKAPRERVPRSRALARAIRITPFESLMAVALFGVAAGLLTRLATTALSGPESLARTFLVLWLLYYALIYVSGPLYAYKSYVTFRPEETGPASPPVARSATAKPRKPASAPG